MFAKECKAMFLNSDDLLSTVKDLENVKINDFNLEIKKKAREMEVILYTTPEHNRIVLKSRWV